jgi:site-specific DNA recombinase
MDKSLELQNKNIGIWIRVSTEDQARGDSPEIHETRARAYAESRGWYVKEVYHLEAVSGKSVMEHPENIKMLDDVRSGNINALIFSKLARLARNTKELLDFSDYFRENDADLISLQESIDTSTPVGRLFYTVIAAMAQWEREEIVDRVKASIPVRAKMGKSLGGKAPYGYQWIDGECIPHPDEAPICKRIFELFIEHRRLRTVARLLNEAGYRTSNGKPFEYSAIKRVLTNPAAKGIRRANYVNRRSSNKKRSLKPESEWVYLPVESIVSEELWDGCNAILADRPKRPPSKKVKRLLAGFTYCECGQKMYPVSNSPKYVCQKCRNKIPIVDLDDIYYEQLKGFFHSPEDIEKQLSKADSNIKEKEELIPVLLKEQDSITKELDMVYQL